MLSLLIVGYGNHTKKNILPAIERSNKIIVSGILVKNKVNYNQSKYNIIEQKDIKKISFDAVYIATPISSHYNLIKKFSNLCDKIICEKPLTLNSLQTKKIIKLTKNRGVKLHEVSMYRYHQQYLYLKNILNKNINKINTISTNFSIPKLEKNNTRYIKKMGGGGLLDVGYYPISILISLLGKPLDIKAFGVREKNYEVILKGAALFKYKNFIAVANWGLNSSYKNYFKFSTNNEDFYFERIFSKPHNYKTYYLKNSNGINEKISLGEDDQFLNMLKNILFSKNSIKDRYNVENIANVIDVINKQISKK